MLAQGSDTDHQPVHVYGVPVHCCSAEHVLCEIGRNIQGARAKRYICITNTESMYFAKRIPEHLHYIENAYFSLCDGIGVVIAGRVAGKRVPRLNGPVLVELCCQRGVNEKWRHFFCGGKEGIADLLCNRLMKRFPGMITAGTFCPPFRHMSAAEADAMVHTINATKPDILWVGLGLLKQEAWIVRHFHELDVPWMVGVGAAFDFLAGSARRAPRLIRDAGMEWFYRLCFEPRMLVRNARSFALMFRASAYEWRHARQTRRTLPSQ